MARPGLTPLFAALVLASQPVWAAAAGPSVETAPPSPTPQACARDLSVSPALQRALDALEDKIGTMGNVVAPELIGPLTQEERQFLVRRCMENDIAMTVAVFPAFGVQSEEFRAEMVLLASTDRFDADMAMKHFDAFGEFSRANRVRLALALVNGDAHTAAMHFTNLGLTEESDRFTVARAIAMNYGLAAMQDFNRFDISDPPLRQEIILAALLGSTRNRLDVGEVAGYAHAYLGEDDAYQWVRLFPFAGSADQGFRPFGIGLQDLSFESLVNLVQDPENSMHRMAGFQNLLSGLPSSVLWGPVRKLEVTARLIAGLAILRLRARSDPAAAAALADLVANPTPGRLFSHILGLDPARASSLEMLSTDRFGALLEAGLDLWVSGPAFLTPLLQATALPDSYFSKGGADELLEFFVTARNLLSLGLTDFNHPLPQLREIAMGRVRELFSANPDVQFTSEDFSRLSGLWGGDLSPFYTLIARFQSNSAWKGELPMLGRVFQTTLKGAFLDYKMNGFPGDSVDRRLAEAQGGFLSPLAKAAWSSTHSSLAVYDPLAQDSMNLAERTAQWKRDIHNQVRDNLLLHVQELTTERRRRGAIEPTLDASQERALVDGILSGRAAPRQVFEGLKPMVATHGLIQDDSFLLEVMLHAALPAFTRLSEAASNTEEGLRQLRRLAQFFSALSGQLGFGGQIRADLKALVGALASSPASRPAAGGNGVAPKSFIFTTTVLDPKLLLTVGDLVNTSSCQNYRSGSHIETLLGYVVDANVQALVSWVITPQHFEGDAGAFEDVTARLARGEVPTLDFNAPVKRLTIIFPDGTRYETAPLGYAQRRHIVKLGRTVDGVPGLRRERAYMQPHPADGVISDQMEAVFEGLASAMGAETGGDPIQIPRSRNLGGVYTDALKGIRTGGYELP